MAVIYKATNKINGKSYIGFAVDIEKRKKEHKRKSELDNKYKQYFHNAISKYGFESFEWEIIKTDASIEDEKMLIEEHNTFWKNGKGYNLTMGGEGKLGYIVSEETKRKLSTAHKKRKPTEKQLEALRQNAVKMKEFGHTEETKKRISESHKGKVFSEEHRLNISKNHTSKKDTGKFYHSEEYKDKMRKSLTGKTRTPEQKERYRMAAIKREAEKKRVLQGF